MSANAAEWHSFTRDQLVDALTRLEMKVPMTGPVAGKVNAESMADAIIRALPASASARRRRAADMVQPLMALSDQEFREVLIFLGPEKCQRLREVLFGGKHKPQPRGRLAPKAPHDNTERTAS